MQGALLAGGMESRVSDVLHPLAFVKTARGGIRGEYFQPQPAFAGRFCSRLDGVKNLLAVAVASLPRHQVELMQQRTHRAIFSHSLLKAIFSETNGGSGFGDEPMMVGIGKTPT